MIPLGTISIIVRFTMLKYELIKSFMTSVSIDSRSDRVPDALSTGGGASIAAIRFLFLEAKKLPKKPEFSGVVSKDWGFGGACWDRGIGFPDFGSTCTGFEEFLDSFTMAMAR